MVLEPASSTAGGTSGAGTASGTGTEEDSATDGGPWSLLASAVSDDLRASLSLVGGYSQTLLHLPLDEEAREHHVAGLLAATGAVAQAAQEVLDLVLATAGRPGLHRRPVSADWLLGRLGRSGPGDGAAGVGAIECRADPDLALVDVDPAWITHALRILVMHAQRHPAAGGGVSVHAHGNANSVVLSVRTRGQGEPGAAVPQLPRPVPARTEGGESHLALCRQIVEANGGSLRLDETPARCFATIGLPALHPPERQPSGRPGRQLR